MNMTDLCDMHKHAEGIPVLKGSNQVCRACRMGKARKLPFKGQFIRSEKVGDIVHSDIVGPFEKSYPDRYRYFATFKDDHSRYDFAGLMRQKSNLGDAFKSFLLRFHDLCSAPVGSINVHQDQLDNFSDVVNISRSCILIKTKSMYDLGMT